MKNSLNKIYFKFVIKNFYHPINVLIFSFFFFVILKVKNYLGLISFVVNLMINLGYYFFIDYFFQLFNLFAFYLSLTNFIVFWLTHYLIHLNCFL